MPYDDALRTAIAAAGGEGPLARAIGISVQSVRCWRRTPAHRVIQVEAATGVPRLVLRPDLYGGPIEPGSRLKMLMALLSAVLVEIEKVVPDRRRRKVTGHR